jgi:hypothetical protein
VQPRLVVVVRWRVCDIVGGVRRCLLLLHHPCRASIDCRAGVALQLAVLLLLAVVVRRSPPRLLRCLLLRPQWLLSGRGRSLGRLCLSRLLWLLLLLPLLPWSRHRLTCCLHPGLLPALLLLLLPLLLQLHFILAALPLLLLALLPLPLLCALG